MDYKRLLIVSNAALSLSESNGRTLSNFVSGWDKSKLAQFYTYGEPDFDVCSNYYKVSDGDALKSLLKFKPFGGPVEPPKSSPEQTARPSGGARKKVKKTPTTALLREFVWSRAAWKKRAFKKWLDDFAPEIVLVFMGDSSFLSRIAMEIAEKRRVPLVLYSCENYYFKEYNYITKKKSFAYRLFHRAYKKTTRALTKQTKRCVFISEALMNCYQTEFPTIRADYVMTASGLRGLEPAADGTLITYAGNLGVGRDKPLIEIGDALQKIDPNLKIALYGRFPSREIEERILACPGVDYRGFVPYSEVVSAIQNSRLLVHVETDDPFYRVDLRHAFSTKISDCVASGAPFFCYAPKTYPFVEFLTKNGCAIVASEKSELVERLKIALFDDAERARAVKNAGETADRYFDLQKNRAKFQRILLDAASEPNE